MTAIAERLADVQQRMADAAARAGRSPAGVRLIAASKRQAAAAIAQLADLGVRDFGESQLQDAVEKIPQFAAADLDWHFIGHLQSNKTRHIPAYFNWVHSVDSLKLARRISEAAVAAGRPVKLLLQVNVAGDPAKHGILPDELFSLTESILKADLAGIELRGLMTIGFRAVSEDETRAGFARLRTLLEAVRERFGGGFSELSMGMSGDYGVAIEEGATMVRVGTALFGPRD